MYILALEKTRKKNGMKKKTHVDLFFNEIKKKKK